MSTKLLKSLLFFILAVSIAYPLNSIELNQVLDNSLKHNNLQSALVGVKIIDSQSNTIIFFQEILTKASYLLVILNY